MRRRSRTLVTAVAFLGFSFPTSGWAESLDGVVLFQNVRVFNGKSSELSAPTNVLVRGNKIEKITTDDIPTEQSPDTTIIDGNGRTLMPGLIDMHWHAMLVRPSPSSSQTISATPLSWRELKQRTR